MFFTRLISTIISYCNIFKELQIQDKTLAEQTNVYLKKIIEQNEEILKEIKKRKEQIDYSFLK